MSESFSSDSAGAAPLLILATHNEHKVGELRNILGPLLPGLDPARIVSAAAFNLPEPVEDEVTFAGNALIKARAVAAATGILTVADDSGLCVDVLGGAPGVFSARWVGRHGDDLVATKQRIRNGCNTLQYTQLRPPGYRPDPRRSVR